MTLDTCLGLAAGALTSGAAIPQVVRTFRTKQARDLSIWQPILLDIGMILWLAYGVMLKDLPLIAANTFSIACYSWLIVMKLRYGKDERSACRPEAEAEAE